MVQHRLKAKGSHKARATGAALCFAALATVTSCVMPLAAKRVNPPVGLSAVTIRLDPPKPFDPALDPAVVVAATSGAVLPGTEAAVDAAFAAQLGALPVEPALYRPSNFAAGAAAIPFSMRGASSTDMLRASLCLTSAVYYEAANEPDDGQRAVAQVVLNRVRHPAYPNTVCGVVYQGTERNDTLCQFTFGCDGAMARAPSSAGWSRARKVALSALSGSVFAPVGLATNYHTLAVAPVWNKTLTPTGIFGAHIFFKMPGGAGELRAFHARYRGFEPTPAPKPKLYVAPLPAPIFASAAPLPLPSALPQPWVNPSVPAADTRVANIAPTRSVAADRRYVAGALPESDVLPAYRTSGQWIGR